MNIEYYKKWSNALNQDMEFKIYGHAGKPIVVFPSQGGRFYDYEDFGMVGACNWFIEEGKVQVYTVDSVDNQSWANWGAHPADRARRHNDYDWYITDELKSFIRDKNPYKGKYMTTGCSMGAYHAGNFFFRHPDIFDSVIALSGLFRLNIFIGDYMDDNVYFNSPLAFLPNLSDPAIINQYRDSKIIICSGRGAWEDAMLEDALSIKRILEEKGISAWVDIWGHDVNHDWPWWRHMMPYFLGKMDL
jgi:esterase/lipase superfamily enzyme